MRRLLTLESGIDLRPFCAFLWQQGVAHSVSEEAGQQVLWLAEAQQEEQVQVWFEQWQSGDLVLGEMAVASMPRSGGYRWRASFLSFPVTWLFLALCIAGAIWTSVGDNLYRALDLMLLKAVIDGQQVAGFLTLPETMAQGEFWRLFTPALLHFGWMHLVFNMLWLHELGKRIEPRFGALFMLLLVLASGVASNLIQYGYGGGSPLFGGFSGIVYALLGFIWVYQWRKPAESFQLPRGVIAFMMIWLLLGVVGVFDQLLGPMANAAHIGGLLAGVLCGVLAVFLNLKKKVRGA